MPGYTKLFSSILHSTVWREANHVRILWITLLAMADKSGIAETSIPGLADAARISLPDCEDALQRLQTPDPYSRTGDSEGRRIEPVDGGWRIINHGKYRAKMNAEERREYLRIKQAEHRKKSTRRQHVVDTYTQSTHAEAEAEAEAELSIERESVKAPKVRKREETSVADGVIEDRARMLIERYQALYPVHRHGARLRLAVNSLAFQDACDLARHWDDARIEKLAEIVLTTDDPFISGTDRSFRIFAMKASWADDRLCEIEAKRKRA